jgi:membrane protein YdbS with pleckstrin-like domain
MSAHTPHEELPRPQLLSTMLDTTAPDPSGEATVVQPESLSGSVIYRGRRRLSSFEFWLIGIVLIAYGLFWGGLIATTSLDSDAEVLLLILGAALVISFGVALMDAWLRSRTTLYTIYERRIEIQKGILSRKIATIWLYEIEDVSYSLPFLLRLTNNAEIT